MKKLFLLILALLLSACSSNATAPDPAPAELSVQSAQKAQPGAYADVPGEELAAELRETGLTKPAQEVEPALLLTINGTQIPVDWEDNESVEALRGLAADAPLTIEMSPYGGFEQVGPIGQSLPRNDVQITTEPGDLVLYSGNQIVVFYGSNSWAYTRLGRIRDLDPTALTELLGGDAVSLGISCSR